MPAPDDDDHHLTHHHSFPRDMFHGLLKAPSRPHTPLSTKLRALNGASQSGPAPDPDPAPDDDAQVLRFRALYDESEARIASLFDQAGNLVVPEKRKAADAFEATQSSIPDIIAPDSQPAAPTSKKRKLDDDYDDYDDDDDDDDDDDEPDSAVSPLKAKSAKVHVGADRHASPVARPVPPSRPSSEASKSEAANQKEKPEEARKKLEEAKRLEMETVKTMSRQFFFTLENDRDAMLDQHRLDEAERRADAEAEGHAKGPTVAAPQGSLSNANLGASSLTLKNLIARIDQRRHVVQASESELRALMSEVRKNRSKWASEDKVGQEELYEAAEKVLNELKAQTEHSGPFLQPVKKKDAPDYHVLIKAPMDLGTMTKKLKQLAYRSKHDFCDDLHLIWTNCLKYNSAPDHPMRKHALFMRKETDKLVPLIPDIVIRDRAEIEAEERKQRIANGELDDNVDDSDDDDDDDDDQPIMASRGRAAPGSKKTSKTTQTARTTQLEATPQPEPKPAALATLHGLPHGGRADSDADGGSQGPATPPPGTLTPGLDRGAGSVVDAASEVPDNDIPGLAFAGSPPEAEDDEYRLWKQKTKKDRARIAAARHKLFRGDKLNADEDALLRTKAGMRRWHRRQHDRTPAPLPHHDDGPAPPNQRAPTLAEGLEPDEEESMLPDYYDPLAAIPDLHPHLRWEDDVDGHVIEQHAAYLRLYPPGQFVAPPSKLTARMADNMRQIQDTRKIVSKIGVVKQMQLQTQIYQNQFTKYEPAPFVEADVPAHVMTDAGPLMAPWVAKAALTRSLGEIFFHAGFEEFQPAAMDAVADMAHHFFHSLGAQLAGYLRQEQVAVAAPTPVPAASSPETPPALGPALTAEEAVLHTLYAAGVSLNDLHFYAADEMDRMATRLQTMYDRMRAHYAELLKPAVTDDTATGAGAFETGEQYVGGDFADDLGEDFFGFRELGLDREFGLVNLSVPLHLLHNRLTTAAQKATDGGDAEEKLFVPPSPYPRVNVENVESEIGLVQAFFKHRLKENGDRPLPEDLDLPVKQRKGYGRARVPATGKIGDGKVGPSPQKKAPAPSAKVDNKPVPKISLTNGVKDDQRKGSLAASVHNDTTMTDADAPEGTGPPTPTPHPAELDGDLISPEKPPPTTPAHPPRPPRPSDARKTGDTAMAQPSTDRHVPGAVLVNGASANDHHDGDFSSYVNGMDSPPPSATGTEPNSDSKKKKGKTKKAGIVRGERRDSGNGDGMISPESL